MKILPVKKIKVYFMKLQIWINFGFRGCCLQDTNSCEYNIVIVLFEITNTFNFPFIYYNIHSGIQD